MAQFTAELQMKVAVKKGLAGTTKSLGEVRLELEKAEKELGEANAKIVRIWNEMEKLKYGQRGKRKAGDEDVGGVEKKAKI